MWLKGKGQWTGRFILWQESPQGQIVDQQVGKRREENPAELHSCNDFLISFKSASSQKPNNLDGIAAGNLYTGIKSTIGENDKDIKTIILYTGKREFVGAGGKTNSINVIKESKTIDELLIPIPSCCSTHHTPQLISTVKVGHKPSTRMIE
jgi:hypothetical protein